MTAMAEPALDSADGLGIERTRGERFLQERVQKVEIDRIALRPEVRPPRLVPLVDVRRRELEDQLRGKRRGDLAPSGVDVDLPGLNLIEQEAQARQIEVFTQALAEGLDDDRKIGKPAHHLEQVLGTQALEPQRRPL